jgi:hypothetical protein
VGGEEGGAETLRLFDIIRMAAGDQEREQYNNQAGVPE